VTVGKKTLEDDAIDLRARVGTEDERVPVQNVLKWVLER
jgi:hypothetical protein